MPRPNLAVRLDKTGHGTVTVNGEELGGVRAVTVKTEYNCLPLVVIELVANSVDLQQNVTEGEAV